MLVYFFNIQLKAISMRAKCRPGRTRNRFLEKVEAAGLALPVSDEWLEAEMEKEWLAHAFRLSANFS